MTKILHLLPRVPPAVCGIGDYAWGIARRLRGAHDIESSFLSAGTNWTQPQGETEFPVFRLPELSAESLVSFLTARRGEFEAVILHMSAYGYQKRGVPWWLASGWQHLAAMQGRPRLITMFHELYASGSMRTSAFWLQPLQKWVLRQIARASDAVRTNRQAYARWLRTVPGLESKDLPVMPVFSNFGELRELPLWQKRSSRMVMFAAGIHGGHNAAAALRRGIELCRHFGMTELEVMGVQADLEPSSRDVAVTCHDYLAAQDLSHLLAGSRMAFTGYHPDYLAKSGVFASFAAHGLATVTVGMGSELPDGLKEKKHILNLEACLMEPPLSGPDLDKLGRGLHEWYAGHSLSQTAVSFARQIIAIEGSIPS